MECIKKFMEESYQYRLRLFAQSRSERYEETIENYKKIFLAHFKLVKKECDLPSCDNKSICDEMRKVLNSITDEEISDFFDELKATYLLWIDADCISAIEKMDLLLKKYDLYRYEREIKDYDVFFKGRVSTQILTSYDMFHIPFNKRYLIQNQRFSLTGQPMLYIGSSILDITREIEAKDATDLKISIVSFKNKNLKIYDLRNNIEEVFVENMVNIFLGQEVEFDKSFFFNKILDSICRFQKKQEMKGFSFCEEYVLPQLLAQLLKSKGFDGIAYFSTKRYDDVYDADTINNKNIDLNSRENIAIFTKLNTEHVYDKELYEKLHISVPVDIKKIDLITPDDLREINNEIRQSKKQDKVTQADRITSSFLRIYEMMCIDGKKYLETDFGKLHMYELYMVLNQILIS